MSKQQEYRLELYRVNLLTDKHKLIKQEDFSTEIHNSDKHAKLDAKKMAQYYGFVCDGEWVKTQHPTMRFDCWAQYTYESAQVKEFIVLYRTYPFMSPKKESDVVEIERLPGLFLDRKKKCHIWKT